MRERLCHKLKITEEAHFDYTECMNLGRLPTKDIKWLVEDYLAIMEFERKLGDDIYIRLKYYDEQAKDYMMLYLYKGIKMRTMQLWELAGIGYYKDWSQEQEDDGLIRNWLKAKVTPDPNEEDWVVRLNLWREEQEKARKEFEEL